VPLVAGLLIDALGGSNKASVLTSVAVLVVGIAITVLGVRGSRSAAKWIGLVIGVVLVLIGSSDVAFLANTHGYGGLFVIAIGLLGLAWMERSRLCGIVALLFTGAALLADLYDMENVLSGFPASTQTVTFDNLVLPAAVLIVGGIVALTAGRRSRQ
jgi:hypothetical protein